MILKISLKPLDKFFFGGENSFKETGGNDNDRRATYLLHSRNYPQQTGILGLIRNQLLLQSGLLSDNSAQVKDKAAAKELIGDKSFRMGATGPYGIIEAVGPVFLGDAGGSSWWPAPLDDVLMKKEDDPPYAMQLEKNGRHAFLQGYLEKLGLHAQLQRISGDNLTMDAAFVTQEQVGISKGAKPWGNEIVGQDDEEGYYYQGFVRFAASKENTVTPDRFCCYLKLLEAQSPLISGIVEMGGERSTFYMDVEPMDELTDIPEPEPVAYRNTTRAAGIATLVCMSPAWIPDQEALQKHALLLATQTIPFRFLKSEANTDHHQNVQRKNRHQPNGNVTESKLYQLLDRGSVVHFDAANETLKNTITHLFNHPGLQQIGYNQYCLI